MRPVVPAGHVLGWAMRKTYDRRGACALLAAVLAGVVWLTPVVALAYNETGTVDPAITDCNACHAGDYQKGPHGGYVTTTSKCDSCHSVHDAPVDSVKLLPGSTVRATCEACHDGTGGRGVYGVLVARGVAVSARHGIDTTNLVPGGDAATGGSATKVFTGEGGNLSCDDCHSPHDAKTVLAFTGDRARTSTDTTGFTGNRLLRRLPTSASRPTTYYGSDWCGGCHSGRLSAVPGVHNHPVDSASSTANFFYYERVAVVTTETSILTTYGPMGRTNRGYVMPYPRTTEQTGHAPICQQCHEDKRSVGTSGAVQYFVVTSADGANSSDNPRFQVFPHESDNAAMLLQTGEDLCLNCHNAGGSMQ